MPTKYSWENSEKGTFKININKSRAGYLSSKIKPKSKLVLREISLEEKNKVQENIGFEKVKMAISDLNCGFISGELVINIGSFRKIIDETELPDLKIFKLIIRGVSNFWIEKEIISEDFSTLKISSKILLNGINENIVSDLLMIKFVTRNNEIFEVIQKTL